MKWPPLSLNPTVRQLRQFAAAWAAFFGTLGIVQLLAQRRPGLGFSLCALACLGVVGLLRPRLVRWLYIGSAVVTYPIGWVISHVVLAAVFYLVLTPIALVLRLARRDVLKLRDNPEHDTLWTERRSAPEPDRYLRQF